MPSISEESSNVASKSCSSTCRRCSGSIHPHQRQSAAIERMTRCRSILRTSGWDRKALATNGSSRVPESKTDRSTAGATDAVKLATAGSDFNSVDRDRERSVFLSRGTEADVSPVDFVPRRPRPPGLAGPCSPGNRSSRASCGFAWRGLLPKAVKRRESLRTIRDKPRASEHRCIVPSACSYIRSCGKTHAKGAGIVDRAVRSLVASGFRASPRLTDACRAC